MDQFGTSSDSEVDVVNRDPDSAPWRIHHIQMIESDSDDLSDSLSDCCSDYSDVESDATDTSDVSEPLDQTADELEGASARKADELGGVSARKADELEGASARKADELGGASARKADELGGASARKADELGGASARKADELGGVSERKADVLGGASARKADELGGASARKADNVRGGGRSPRQDSRAAHFVKDDFPTLLATKAHADVLAAVKSDACLMEYGEHLNRRCGVGRQGRLRHKMWELGRLLICSRKTGPLKTIRDHVAPANFMHAVRAVMRVSGFDGETKTYERPSLVLKLGHDLKAISRLAESRAGERGDHAAARDARAFRAAYEASWSELLTDGCLNRKLRVSRSDGLKAPLLLRFTEDVQALHSYLDAQQQRFQSELSREPTPRKWALLAQLTLTQVVLFNRRRTAEVSGMSLFAYLSPDPPEPEDDGDAALSELEKELCRQFGGIQIRGEKGEKVAVLLTPAMRQALDLLVGKRHECRVRPGNAYLFARPLAWSCFQGSDCLQFFARFCGAKSPDSLTSLKLRRQTGTLSQVLNLRNAELDRLADFLGRDLRVDWQFYRLPEGALPLARISKVFMALDRLAGVQGWRSLEDVSIDPDEAVQMDSDDKSGSQLPDVSRRRRAGAPQGGTKAPRCKYRKSKGGKKARRSWTTEEIAAVNKHLASFIASRRVPRKSDCERCLWLEREALQHRDWFSLKYYINNQIAKKKEKV